MAGGGTGKSERICIAIVAIPCTGSAGLMESKRVRWLRVHPRPADDAVALPFAVGQHSARGTQRGFVYSCIVLLRGGGLQGANFLEPATFF